MEAPLRLTARLYDAKGTDREVPLDEANIDALAKTDLLWIDVTQPDEATVQRLSQLVCMPTKVLAGADLAERPMLENHGSCFRFSVDAAPVHHGQEDGHQAPPSRAETDEGSRDVPGSVRIQFVVAERWLLTLHEADVPCFDRFRSQDKADTSIGLLTGQMLAASLLDWHLGEYFQEVSRIEATVDRLDERVLRETATKTLLGRMVALRRRVSKLRALLVAQRDVFYGLSRPDFALVTDSGAAPFYEALVQRFQRALDEVERSRDVVVGSFELFTSRTSQQTNDLVKVLTFLTAIVGFCAAIAGLMGMNFKLSFFETGMTGFAIVTGGLLVIALCSVAYARYRKWI
jgi:Mg2+ and Co2+ transporter CorA